MLPGTLVVTESLASWQAHIQPNPDPLGEKNLTQKVEKKADSLPGNSAGDLFGMVK